MIAPDGSFEIRILAIRKPLSFAEVKGRGIEDVYFRVQIIITGEYVNWFLRDFREGPETSDYTD